MSSHQKWWKKDWRALKILKVFWVILKRVTTPTHPHPPVKNVYPSPPTPTHPKNCPSTSIATHAKYTSTHPHPTQDIPSPSHKKCPPTQNIPSPTHEKCPPTQNILPTPIENVHPSKIYLYATPPTQNIPSLTTTHNPPPTKNIHPPPHSIQF